MIYFITFRPSSSAIGKIMPIDAVSKQEALDTARLVYGKAVLNILSRNEIQGQHDLIKWGSVVTYQEVDMDTGAIIQTLNYPILPNVTANPLKSILEWFSIATPEPSNKDIAVQIGCHIEEFREMLKSLEKVNPIEIGKAHAVLEVVENLFKSLGSGSKEFDFKGLPKESKIELLDSLADQVVTASGIAHRMNFNFMGALSEVSRSNWSKFVNGKPVRNEQGKIIKGKNYSPPNLEQFI